MKSFIDILSITISNPNSSSYANISLNENKLIITCPSLFFWLSILSVFAFPISSSLLNLSKNEIPDAKPLNVFVSIFPVL